MTWSREIKAARGKLAIKQVALADVLGVDVSTVSRWESGQQVPNIGARRQIQRALQQLGVDIDVMAAERLGQKKSSRWSDIIRGYRAGNGLTQQDVADRLGVSVSTVSAWEMGRRSPCYVVLTLASSDQVAEMIIRTSKLA